MFLFTGPGGRPEGWPSPLPPRQPCERVVGMDRRAHRLHPVAEVQALVLGVGLGGGVGDAHEDAGRERTTARLLPVVLSLGNAAAAFGSGEPQESFLYQNFVRASEVLNRAVAAQYEAMAELILCCGLGDLESLEMIGAKPDAAVLHHESSSTEPKP